MRWQQKEREEALEESLERFLRDIAARYGSAFAEQRPVSPSRGSSPAVSLIDTGATFILRAELPGVSSDRVKVTTGAKSVTIEGQWSDESETAEGSYILREGAVGAFRRVVELPETVAGDLSVALLENGVLEIELPKHSDPDGAASDIILA